MTLNQNYNYLTNKDFRMEVKRLPGVSYFCKTISIPSVTGAAIEMPTPFTKIKLHGDSLVFPPLMVTFNVDVDLFNYQEVLDWMVSYGTPTSFDQYKSSDTTSRAGAVAEKVSDISVFTSTNKYNPNVHFVFEDAFPIDLGTLEFDVSQEDVPVISCVASFAYTKFRIER